MHAEDADYDPAKAMSHSRETKFGGTIRYENHSTQHMLVHNKFEVLNTSDGVPHAVGRRLGGI